MPAAWYQARSATSRPPPLASFSMPAAPSSDAGRAARQAQQGRLDEEQRHDVAAARADRAADADLAHARVDRGEGHVEDADAARQQGDDAERERDRDVLALLLHGVLDLLAQVLDLEVLLAAVPLLEERLDAALGPRERRLLAGVHLDRVDGVRAAFSSAAR